MRWTVSGLLIIRQPFEMVVVGALLTGETTATATTTTIKLNLVNKGLAGGLVE
jgi:hypothetical protein